MTGSTVISCRPRDGGSTAQSSPMPNGARGDTEPSHRRISVISFCSPRAETDCEVRLVKGCTVDQRSVNAKLPPSLTLDHVGWFTQEVAPERSNTMLQRLN